MCNRYIDYAAANSTGRDKWWKSVALGFAYLTEHWEDARKVLDDLEDEPDADALGRFPVSSDVVVTNVHLHTGPHAAAILEALAWAEDGLESEALSRLRELVRDETIHPLVRRRMRSRLQALQWKHSFEGCESVDLFPDSTLGGWTAKAGEWSTDLDSSSRGVSNQTGVILQCLADFGSTWELSGEIEYGASPYADWDAGVLLYVNGDARYSIMANPTENWVAAGPCKTLKAHHTPYELKERVLPFVIRLEAGVVNVWINDSQVIEDKTLEGWTDNQNVHLAIGAKYNWNGSVLTYRGLRIKQLESGG